MLSFLNLALREVRGYYAQNRDLTSIRLDARKEYPLFVRVVLENAYDTYKKEAWEVQFHWAKERKYLVAELQKMATKQSFTFGEFVRNAKVENEEAKQFLAFAIHTGLLQCVNERERHENRRYQFPILFFQIPEAA
jgi:hypothetical protein